MAKRFLPSNKESNPTKSCVVLYRQQMLVELQRLLQELV
jgi:hypothetical protein